MGTDLYVYVGKRIRELRSTFDGGRGISQEALGEALDVTANTISRWETATYQPSLRDLEKLSRFFGRTINHFLPGQPATVDENLGALLRAAQDLPQTDREELRRFAEFRRAHALFPKGRPSKGRPQRKRA